MQGLFIVPHGENRPTVFLQSKDGKNIKYKKKPENNVILRFLFSKNFKQLIISGKIIIRNGDIPLWPEIPAGRYQYSSKAKRETITPKVRNLNIVILFLKFLNNSTINKINNGKTNIIPSVKLKQLKNIL